MRMPNLINIYLQASLLFEAKYDGIFGELHKAAIYNIEKKNTSKCPGGSPSGKRKKPLAFPLNQIHIF